MQTPESYLLELAGKKCTDKTSNLQTLQLVCLHVEDELFRSTPILAQQICHNADLFAMLDGIL